jgi:hypothetical protein
MRSFSFIHSLVDAIARRMDRVLSPSCQRFYPRHGGRHARRDRFSAEGGSGDRGPARHDRGQPARSARLTLSITVAFVAGF